MHTSSFGIPNTNLEPNEDVVPDIQQLTMGHPFLSTGCSLVFSHCQRVSAPNARAIENGDRRRVAGVYSCHQSAKSLQTLSYLISRHTMVKYMGTMVRVRAQKWAIPSSVPLPKE